PVISSEQVKTLSLSLRTTFLRRYKRRWVLSTIELAEDEPGPFPRELSQMFNDMVGNDHEFRISGRGVNLEPVNLFSIDPDTGIVYVHRSVDRESYERPFHIKFDIYNKTTGAKLDRELSFDVEIIDINDNTPTFSPTQMTADVEENTEAGEKHSPNKYEYTYKIKTYDIIVQAKDHGTPSLSSTAAVTLNIVDKNSHSPMFKEKKVHIFEILLQLLLVLWLSLLTVAVDDLDTPKTPGWRAKYFFIKGNEDGSYKIETDPDTNEGVLSVIKRKDFERTTETTLEIGVENEENLWVCNKKTEHSPDSAIIIINVIDVNDPPEFKQSPIYVYGTEEEQPGEVLLTPEIHDPDSNISQIRFVLLEDPANWMSIDKKTGAITAIKTMDRESPFLNGTDEYKIVIGAIDDGEPEATGTTTVKIHLRDINDNVPTLVNKGVIMCANKVNKVMVAAKDADVAPFSLPFTFSLGGDDKSNGSNKRITQHLYIFHPPGEECGLISQKILTYRNYSVPLEIRDQENMIGHETLEVMVCDCGKKDVCGYKEPLSVRLGALGIALLFVGLLLFLCEYQYLYSSIPPRMDGWMASTSHNLISEEGNQTLIQYNQEGGLSECKVCCVN
uniref:Cadherin domain-containing protein n=1 Tax=Mola mola TaxID=94237 RepID=A0A3Q4BPL5_MOLML